MHNLVVVRGGGDIATGCVQKLYRAGFRVVILETECPRAIRRGAALCEAVYTGRTRVEDITAELCNAKDAEAVIESGRVPVITDPDADFIKLAKPLAVVDAIMAKKNTGTHRGMARVTIGLGPGFNAPWDVNIVVETKRGHDLGRLIFKGSAMANTGLPAEVAGAAAERVVYAPAEGTLRTYCDIGEIIRAGQRLAGVGDKDIYAPISGVLRGILPQGYNISAGLKLADIDPREDSDCFSISDKARCIGGAALEGLLMQSGGVCRL